MFFGIIGGMGPEADEYFQKVLREETKAKVDQENIPVVVIKNTKIPDRPTAMLNGGADPVYGIRQSAKMLESLGVEFAIITCNTAHYFLDRVQSGTSIKILNMIEIASLYIKEKHSDDKVGLLATSATLKTGVYDKYLQNFIKPEQEIQENCVDVGIYEGIKAGDHERGADLFIKAIDNLVEQGSNIVVLACTEIPIIEDKLKAQFPDIEFIDPMRIAARKVISIMKR